MYLVTVTVRMMMKELLLLSFNPVKFFCISTSNFTEKPTAGKLIVTYLQVKFYLFIDIDSNLLSSSGGNVLSVKWRL